MIQSNHIKFNNININLLFNLHEILTCVCITRALKMVSLKIELRKKVDLQPLPGKGVSPLSMIFMHLGGVVLWAL